MTDIPDAAIDHYDYLDDDPELHGGEVATITHHSRSGSPVPTGP